MPAPRIERLTVYPVKGLDGMDAEESRLLPGGTLRYDREFALVDADGEVLNGKRTDRVHDLETDFDPETRTLTVEPPAGERRSFALEGGTSEAAEWFSDFFGLETPVWATSTAGGWGRRSSAQRHSRRLPPGSTG